jgi:endonuclease/exonuclease/phosphatase family metal-dependent hydrolase
MRLFRTCLLLVTIVTLAGCLGPVPGWTTATQASVPTSMAVPTAPATRRSPPTATLSSDDAFLKKIPGSLRLMTYNVNWDSIFPEDDPENHDLRAFDRVDSFRRILQAIRPDVLCLQEVNDRRHARDLVEFVEAALGATPGEGWQVAHVRDDVIASRFSLQVEDYELVTGSVLYYLDQAAALVDLPDHDYGSTDLYVICSHFASGGDLDDILLRARQADVVMRHVRDVRTLGGNLDLPSGTPFVILGDFNAYDSDPARHLRTLTQGDIYDERSYGMDFDPDWDGSALRDARPSLNGQGIHFYTWRNDSEPFAPWALDRVIFSDSVLHLGNAFVLDTMRLAQGSLDAHGLRREDVLLDPASGNYDHLPVVVDFLVGSGE